jgi:hypothetical protein
VRFKSLWLEPQRYYLEAYQTDLRNFEDLVGQEYLNIVAAGGGKLILTNHPLEHASLGEGIRLSALPKTRLQSRRYTGKKRKSGPERYFCTVPLFAGPRI